MAPSKETKPLFKVSSRVSDFGTFRLFARFSNLKCTLGSELATKEPETLSPMAFTSLNVGPRVLLFSFPLLSLSPITSRCSRVFLSSAARDFDGYFCIGFSPSSIPFHFSMRRSSRGIPTATYRIFLSSFYSLVSFSFLLLLSFFLSFFLFEARFPPASLPPLLWKWGRRYVRPSRVPPKKPEEAAPPLPVHAGREAPSRTVGKEEK